MNMKYALVTGGSRGLGRAVCLSLSRQGIPVVINYQKNTAAAEETLRLIEEQGGKGELLSFDVADPKAVERALEEWEKQHPDDYINVLVNNAGIRQDNLLIFMQNDQWHSVLDTTLNGFFYITRRLLKNMLSHRSGRIINMVSLSGIKGLPGQTNYSAAKAAMIGATKALAQEVAPRKVTVNAVAPGFISTDMTKELDEDTLKKMIPAGRFGKPEEVAALVTFLASADAGYITGEVISINGGLYT
jgi:3-oxoacyl-[acyl-carrier protein] reductase